MKSANKNICMKTFHYDYHGFLNDGQITLIDKTLALDPTKRDSILAWEPLKHTTHMVWICKRNFSGCYYVGVLHGFVCFSEALVFM